MPTEWTTHADGVGTAVSTTHRLDGTLLNVTVQLDTFKVREWPEDEDEIEAAGKNLKHLHYDEVDDVYVEHGGGAHASLRFGVNDAGRAELLSTEPEDGEKIKPRHMALLPAAERIIENLDGVDECVSTLETLANAYHDAGDVFIERLDG